MADKIIPLSAVVAQTESGGYTLASRFEPTVYAKYKAVDDQTSGSLFAQQIRGFEQLHRCSPDTARVLLSTSFGKYQEMGFNLNQNVFSFLNDEQAQDQFFAAYCKKIGVPDDKMVDASWIMTDQQAGFQFAARYNGPAEPSRYLSSLQQSYSVLSKGT